MHQINNRYLSFSGISCNTNAVRLIEMLEMLEGNISAGNGREEWHAYFAIKRQQQLKLQHDNLNFCRQSNKYLI